MGNDRIRIPEPEWSKNLWKRVKAMVTSIEGEIAIIAENAIESISQNGTPLTPDANKNVNINADANVINTVKQNGTALTPDGNKAVNIVADANVIESISLNTQLLPVGANKNVSITAKPIQSQKSSPAANGYALAFIDTIWQDTHGVIYATKKYMVDMTGATAQGAGVAGVVPAPQAGDEGKFLRGDGEWADPGGGGGGGEVNTIESITLNGTSVPPDSNKNVALVETDPTVPSWAKASSKPAYTAGEVGAIPTTQKGAASGVAELDSGGKVPSSQLPSYVDDVLEYSSKSAFPATGEAGKIYVATDTNITYRWSGSAYVEISPSLSLGETSSTAYRGDRGKAAYDHAQAKGGAFANGLYLITTNAEGHVTAAVPVQKSDITALGIPGSDTTYTFTDGDPTLAWGTRSKVGTTGGVDLHVTMPAKPTYTAADVGANTDLGLYIDNSGYICQRIRSDT